MYDFGKVAFRNCAICRCGRKKNHILGVKNVRRSETTPDGIKLTLYLSEKEPSFHLFLVNEPVSTIKHCQALLALDTSKVSIEISSHHTVEKRPNSTNSMPKKSLFFVFFHFPPITPYEHYTSINLH